MPICCLHLETTVGIVQAAQHHASHEPLPPTHQSAFQTASFPLSMKGLLPFVQGQQTQSTYGTGTFAKTSRPLTF